MHGTDVFLLLLNIRQISSYKFTTQPPPPSWCVFLLPPSVPHSPPCLPAGHLTWLPWTANIANNLQWNWTKAVGGGVWLRKGKKTDAGPSSHTIVNEARVIFQDTSMQLWQMSVLLSLSQISFPSPTLCEEPFIFSVTSSLLLSGQGKMSHKKILDSFFIHETEDGDRSSFLSSFRPKCLYWNSSKGSLHTKTKKWISGHDQWFLIGS